MPAIPVTYSFDPPKALVLFTAADSCVSPFVGDVPDDPNRSPGMRRVRGRSGTLDPTLKACLLEPLGRSRNLLTSAMAHFPVRGPEYLAAEAIVTATDGMAEHLTGSREYFWQKAPPASVQLR